MCQHMSALQTQKHKHKKMHHMENGHASSEKGGTLNDSISFQFTSIGGNALY